MNDTDLHSRLEALGHKITTTQAHIVKNQALFKQHHLTGKALEDRYRILKERLDLDAAQDELRGHHVGDLEKSVRAWMATIDAET